MTKKDMTAAIAQDSGVSQVQVKQIVQQVFEFIDDTLVQEGGIELRGFGIFKVKKRKPRQARNPRTGEKVWVREKLVVTFKAGKEVQKRLQETRKLTAPTFERRPRGVLANDLLLLLQGLRKECYCFFGAGTSTMQCYDGVSRPLAKTACMD